AYTGQTGAPWGLA
nr:RecName: Full=Serine proteinase [Scedosporium boydii]